MSLNLRPVRTYFPNKGIVADQIDDEFNGLINMINAKPKVPVVLYRELIDTWNSATKFPLWICPEARPATSDDVDNTLRITKVRLYRQSNTINEPTVNVNFQVNGETVTTLNLTNDNFPRNTVVSLTLSPAITMQPNDLLGIDCGGFSSDTFGSVTMEIIGSMEWYNPLDTGVEFPADRLYDFETGQPIGDPSDVGVQWEAEIANIVAYYDQLYFPYVHTAFYPSSATATDFHRVFFVPANWTSCNFRRLSISFQTRDASDTLEVSCWYGTPGFLSLRTVTLDGSSEQNTAYFTDVGAGGTMVPGDVLYFEVTDGNTNHHRVTVQADIEYRVKGAYSRAVAVFDGLIESSEFNSEIAALCNQYNAALTVVPLTAFYANPNSNGDKALTFSVNDNWAGAVIEKIHHVWFDGNNTNGKIIDVQKNGATIATLSIIAGSTLGDAVTTTLSPVVTLLPGDTIGFDITASSGNEKAVTIQVDLQVEIFK